MPVFTRGRHRDDHTPRRRNESNHDFLDRIAGEYWDHVREIIEAWFTQCAPEGSSDLLARIMDSSDINFDGAIWELMLHSTLLDSGFDVTCHPVIPGTTKRPDFLAERGECSFYLEATVVHEDPEDQGEAARREEVYAQLDDRVTLDDLMLWVEVDREGGQAPSYSGLASAVETWSQALEIDVVRAQYSAGGFGAMEWFTWDDEENSGWVVSVAPIPKKADAGGGRTIGIRGGGGVRMIDDAGAIRRAINRKRRRYGTSFDRPFVLALGVNRMSVDSDDVMSALFGDETVTLSTGSEPVPGRAPNGIWWGPAGSRSPQLSGIVVSRYFRPWSLAKAQPELWRHPSADHALECQLDFLAVWEEAAGAMTFSPAQSSLASLHVGEDWPPGDPFP